MDDTTRISKLPVCCRGAYCAASVARLTNIATPEMFDLTPEWIVRYSHYLHRGVFLILFTDDFIEIFADAFL